MSPFIREPDRSGAVDHNGVEIAYEVHGDGEVTVLLLPAWAIAHSGIWKAQVPYFADHYRVITYDPRGNGRSGKPTDPASYDVSVQVGDAAAVLDACDADRAVIAGLSFGGVLGFMLAATRPDLTAGAVLVAAGLNVDARTDYPLARGMRTFDEDRGVDEGWGRYNRHSMARDFEGFVEFFAREATPEPHSSRAHEELHEQARGTTPEVLAATIGDRAGAPPEKVAERIRSLARGIRCPVLLVHGSEDRIVPVELSRSLAELLDAPLVELEGVGHSPQGRHPAEFNSLMRRFIDETVAATGTAPASSPGVHAATTAAPTSGPVRANGSPRRPRVLYLSSPIGLGHARRDLSIAGELRRLVGDMEIDWLAQAPVADVLEAAGERVHPASTRLVSEVAHLEAASDEHDLHVFEAMRRMDDVLVANFMTFLDVFDGDRYDLVVGDESWEVDHFLHEDPSTKHARFAWLTDFVGYVPMADGGAREHYLTADYNAEMLEHVEHHPGVRDVSIFVGEPDDVVSLPFGPGLPGIREWTEAHYRFPGYVTGFDPAGLGDRAELRAELGYDADETVVVAAVGGSAVGAPLLRRIIAAHPLLAEQVPNLRTVVVAGPRIPLEGLGEAPGVDVRAYVPDLHRHLAACDLAIVQGGLTTTMELTAAGRPFLYFPLRNHFEQQVHVRHRLERYGAGRAMDYASTTAEAIAEAALKELHRPLAYTPVDPNGASRTAAILADLL